MVQDPCNGEIKTSLKAVLDSTCAFNEEHNSRWGDGGNDGECRGEGGWMSLIGCRCILGL